MKHVPSYTKIMTIGSTGTERALIGEVSVQEKADGSMIRWGKTEDGEIVFASHHQPVYLPECPKWLRPFVNHVLSMDTADVPNDTYFYGEYFEHPKQNTLAYGRIPQNHVMLFDCFQDGKWCSRAMLAEWAAYWQIDLVPELYHGETTVEQLRGLLTTPSYLGKEIVEGVVVKNYGELVTIAGQVFPLFVKMVRADFQERNKTEWAKQSGKSKLEELMESYRTEARWRKAIQHLQERGELLGEPKDIGPLMKEITVDLEAEEAETIKKELYELYRKDIIRTAQKGAAEWYKNYLAEGES